MSTEAYHLITIKNDKTLCGCSSSEYINATVYPNVECICSECTDCFVRSRLEQLADRIQKMASDMAWYYQPKDEILMDIIAMLRGGK
jgi:hypothetical protein